MKNQYFGDRNDFFTFDLVLTLIEKIEEFKCFTLITMLTLNDNSNDGRLINYDGSRRIELWDFLKDCIKKSKRDIRNLRAFMAMKNIEYHPYKDDEYFTDEGREKYFSQINPSILKNAVILLDPDNGLEVKSMQKRKRNKYLKFTELKKLYELMDFNSIILVFQYIPRVKRQIYLPMIGKKIYDYINTKKILCISDNKIAFFFLSKNEKILNKVSKLLNNYVNPLKKFQFQIPGIFNPQNAHFPSIT